jgi:hypothetical protein
MVAGHVRLCRLIHFTYPQDDVQGGAIPSGTVLYDNLTIRMKAEKATMALLEQGVDTQQIWSALLFPGNINIEENDQIEITKPDYGWYSGKKFRVIGIQRDSENPWDDRNQIRLTLKRWSSEHSNDLQ